MKVDGSAVVPLTTDLGYQVELSAARLTIQDMQFTVAGEAHQTSLLRRMRNALLPRALAHPGHYQGGEVTGELPGTYVVDWLGDDGAELGLATLLAGDYKAVNFTFGRASANDVESADPLLLHTAEFRGTATKAGRTVMFSALIDSPEGRQLVGVPFEETVTSQTGSSVALRLVPIDPHENDTLFDGLDFAMLPAASDGTVTLTPDAQDEALVAAYELLRRTLQTHDHFEMKPE